MTLQDECKFDDQTRMMLSKAIDDLNNMTKYMEEFCGVLHAMVLELYNQQGIEIPKSIRDYKFRNKNPWGECSVDI